MHELQNKKVLVIGLGPGGQAACRLLRKRGALVTAIDSLDLPDLREAALELRKLGVGVELGLETAPRRAFDLAVLSPAIPNESAVVSSLQESGVPLIGEMELGFQQSLCLSIAISGTNGKTTTAEMVETILTQSGRKTLIAGPGSRPACSIVEATKDLDFLILEVDTFQLEGTRFFRPTVGVLMNISPDHLNRYRTMADYVRTKAKLFANQQAFDWAIVQSEALAQFHSLGLSLPAKVLTFSANNRRADIFLDRGLLLSRVPNWSGPLLDMSQCRLRGPHNAENMMAALAVGHVLRLPLEPMAEALKTHQPPPHRCELIAEVNGVQFINDSKATNLDALQRALLSVPETREPNIWLIAGGRDKGFEYYGVGPLLSRRVKGAFLIGETREKIRAAWSLFTPCTLSDSLLEAVADATKNAVSGDVVLLSPACSSFDQFRDYQHRGEVYRQAVRQLAGPTRGGDAPPDPHSPQQREPAAEAT